MANPYNFQITRIVESNEINFRSLYLYSNWKVHDGPGPNAPVVARIYTGYGKWDNTLSLVFEVGRFRGSTLRVMGVSVEEGEWDIVVGTGQFARATGVISKKRNVRNWPIKLAIHAFCPLPEGSRVRSLVTKIGPFGGSGGTERNIRHAPRRLESITVCRKRSEVIYSIEFSYIDHTGRRRIAGPWGGPGGERYEITLSSSEFVKEVSGTFGKYKDYTVITSLKFVTNDNRTRGHYGDRSGEGTRFSVPVQDSSVVGFFGRSGTYLDAVGVYVHPF